LKGDPSKLMKATGWKPEYTFESMITEMVEYWDKLYKI
jgi:nucleoside-diphosphate-sugar epimerase